ncbi:MAG TPA: TetR/AcrR family transcriptional regulator [Solirubrobacteraceae bacterium]|jgi:AcrR family transcriptional regulator
MSTAPVEQGITGGDVRPQRADARRNRERLVAAATEVFAERGADAGVAEIARRAGVGAGTVHRHFPTKHELLLAALERRFDELQRALAHAETMDDGWEGLVHVLTACAELQARDRGFLESVGPELFGEPRLQARNAEYMASIEALIARTQRAGLVRHDLAAEDLPFLISAVGGATAKCGGTSLSPDLWRRYLGIVLDGIRPAGATELPVPAPTMTQLTATCRAAATD